MSGDSPKNCAAQAPAALFAPENLEVQLTVAQFAAWQQVTERSVRRRLATMPGVIRESRELVRIHPRTYLESRLKKAGR
jgi:hypothetical protein